MLLLMDENVPEAVVDFFRNRGHDVRSVRDLLLPGTPDAAIANFGDHLGAVVVTWDKDFKRLARRVPEGGRRSLRRLGRISFQCREAHGRRRAEPLIKSIEFEYEQAQKRSDKRLIVEITETTFVVVR